MGCLRDRLDSAPSDENSRFDLAADGDWLVL